MAFKALLKQQGSWISKRKQFYNAHNNPTNRLAAWCSREDGLEAGLCHSPCWTSVSSLETERTSKLNNLRLLNLKFYLSQAWCCIPEMQTLGEGGGLTLEDTLFQHSLARYSECLKKKYFALKIWCLSICIQSKAHLLHLLDTLIIIFRFLMLVIV